MAEATTALHHDPTSFEDWKSDWSELLASCELNAWIGVKVHECHCKVRQEDDERKSIVQQIPP